jgi:plasmid stabilization system protein ParE
VQATLNGLYNAIQSLELFPLLGRSVYGFESPNVRELIHEKYRIVYEVAGETVTISSIFHGAEDVEARLRELLG